MKMMKFSTKVTKLRRLCLSGKFMFGEIRVQRANSEFLTRQKFETKQTRCLAQTANNTFDPRFPRLKIPNTTDWIQTHELPTPTETR